MTGPVVGQTDVVHERTPLAAGLDTAVVVTFVSIGRRTHDQDDAVAGLINTAAPFLIALAVAWLLWRVWRHPDSLASGYQVWLTTVAVGMLLRNLVFGDGTALSFIVVATAFLGTFLMGWRLIAQLILRRRRTAT